MDPSPSTLPPEPDQQLMDVYVDGCIAHMLTPGGAQQYFTRLLGYNGWPVHPIVFRGRVYAFFVTSHTVQNVHPSIRTPLDFHATAGRPRTGSIVPQSLSPSADHANGLPDEPLKKPHFFIRNDHHVLGLPLLNPQAVKDDCKTLKGARHTAPVETDTSTLMLRINWAGYPEWSRQVRTREQDGTSNTISLEKFAKRVADAVCKFLHVAQQELQGSDPQWRISATGITKEEVIVIGVIQVSKGTWQPILQRNREVFLRQLPIP